MTIQDKSNVIGSFLGKLLTKFPLFLKISQQDLNKRGRYLRNAKLRKEQEKSLGGCNINLCDQLCLRRGLDIFQVLDGGKIIRQKGGGKSIFCSYYLLHTPHIQLYLKVVQIVKLTNISHLFFSTFLLKIYTSYLKKLLQQL